MIRFVSVPLVIDVFFDVLDFLEVMLRLLAKSDGVGEVFADFFGFCKSCFELCHEGVFEGWHWFTYTYNYKLL